MLPEPTPTPTPIPPTPTPTPVVTDPGVFSGMIVVAGGSVPSEAMLVARVGDYESPPASIQGENYRNLVVDPQDGSYVGQPIEFYLNESKSRTTVTFAERHPAHHRPDLHRVADADSHA